MQSRLRGLVGKFAEDTHKYLSPFRDESSRVVLASAWLVSDNVMVDVLKRHTDFFPSVVAVDTMHLFPETLDTMKAMEHKYGFKTHLYKPEGCESKDDFVRLYGTHQSLSHADFDKHSKVDPLIRAFGDLNRSVTITGRRMDQGNQRVSLDVWEADKKNFNPLSEWAWDDIIAYLLEHDVPYNYLHRVLNVSDGPVPILQRDNYSGFEKKILDKPYFAYSEQEINAHGHFVYIWKSFGDTHSTVPVFYNESERAGRFVGRNQTECGIHTRVNLKGEPHGGKLVDLVVKLEDSPIHRVSTTFQLNERQVCDFELLSNGGFSPLTGFMTQTEYQSVVDSHRLPEGQLFGLPITLDSNREDIKEGDFVLLESDQFGCRGILEVQEKWRPDKTAEAIKVYGTDSIEHPAVKNLMLERGKYYLGGKLWALQLPKRDWVSCLTPRQLRERNQGQNLVAFQSRNPLHRAHVAMLLEVAKQNQARVVVHPVVGPTQEEDIPAIVRKETYDALEALLQETHADVGIQFEYLPYNMVMGGPREALQHAIVRKNYGCTGMIVGRDHAGCKDSKGNDFYGPYDAQELLLPLQKELGMDIVTFQQMVFVEEEQDYVPVHKAQARGYKPLSISGTKFRKMLVANETIPDWFAYPQVVEILRKHAMTQQKTQDSTVNSS
jgi:sulfate adenylyltransferase